MFNDFFLEMKINKKNSREVNVSLKNNQNIPYYMVISIIYIFFNIYIVKVKIFTSKILRVYFPHAKH